MEEQRTPFQILENALKGKICKHTNQHGKMVELEIEKISAQSNLRDLEPSKAANIRYWPKPEEWNFYYLHFVDGSKIMIMMNTKIIILNK